MEKNLIDQVSQKVADLQEAGQLDLPKDYSAGNALRGAWLMLQDQTTKVNGQSMPVLDYCTRTSIASAMLKMVLDGLTPMKSQGSFIVYGNVLKWQREYAGILAMAKRSANVIDATAQIIWESDVFRFGVSNTGQNYIVSHETSFENIGGKIKGAYAVVRRDNFTDHVEIMTWEQIQKAWGMALGGLTKAHAQFPDQMAKKTVLNRALKLFVNSTSDEALYQEPEKELPTLDHLTTQIAERLLTETIEEPVDAPVVLNENPEW